MTEDKTYDLLYQLTENLPDNERITLSSCPLGLEVKRQRLDGEEVRSRDKIIGRLELEQTLIPVDRLLARELSRMATEIRESSR